MRATEYNKRITVQKRTKTETAIKGWTNTWATFYTSWAGLVPLSGAKADDYTRLGFVESYELEMRSRESNVDSDCRIVYDGKNFQITSIKIFDVVNLTIGRK